MNQFRPNCKISVISDLISHFHHEDGNEVKLIIRLMRQLVCFNFHYFIKTVLLIVPKHFQSKYCCIRKNMFRRSSRFFIEPIKAFYLMNAIRAELRQTIKELFFREST